MVVLAKKFETDRYTAQYIVEEDQHNMRLDQFLQIYLESFSREAVKRKIANCEIKIHGRPGTHRPSTRLQFKDIVELITNKTIHEDEWWKGQPVKLELTPEIIFEDSDLIVISKPAYMSTHPTGRHLFNCATVFFEARDGKTIHSIHRLDRETSGILLLGKNPQFTKIMTDHFENDRVKKCYFFIAKVNPSIEVPDQFEANERLGASEEGLRRVYIDHYPEISTEGKEAKTFFKILHRESGYALGLAFPITGRQHQIRVHAMVHGLPLIGDKLYLGSFEMFQRFKDLCASEEDHQLMELPRHALHATALRMPFKGKDKIFISHLPNDFKQWIEQKMTLSIAEIECKMQESIKAYYQKVV